MKALLGIALALAAVAGGRPVANSLDHAIDAPRARFVAAADARVQQIIQERTELAKMLKKPCAALYSVLHPAGVAQLVEH